MIGQIERIAGGVLFLVFCVALVLVLGGLIGCATLQLPENSTGEQKRTAMCRDAKSGMAIAYLALAPGNLSEESLSYWRRWVDGAKAGINAYCED